MLETIGRSGLPTTQERASSGASDPTSAALNQKDFLTLLTAQLKNQDPLKPMENGEFLAQMAQFSTVSGIEKVNDTLTSMAGSSRDSRMATATNLLGHQVLVPGNIARPDATGAVHGVVDLPTAVENVIVSYSDPSSGEILHSESLGPQPAGLVGFTWADMPPALTETNGAVRVSVMTADAQGTQEIGPSVYARVVSARAAGYGSDDITLQIEDYGALNALEVEAFR
jgi:flagellar basal-body rod modification protein FlgD